jgi:hypothetical protein
MPRAVVLVEGESDRLAVEALAARRGRDLALEGVAVRAIGGAQAIRRVLAGVGGGVAVAGLCDAGEEGDFRRALEAAGLGEGLDRAGMERLGFYVCDADLEDELIRALGTERVEALVAAQGELRPFRTLQKQPEHRERTAAQQLHRFLGSGGGRKLRYAPLLVAALDPGSVPPPLDGVVTHVLSRG